MSDNKDLDSVLQASYRQIKDWHKHVNTALAWRLHSRGYNKKYVKAQDVYYFDDDGHRYLDFLGGYGTNSVGHNHPRLKQLINDFLAEDNAIYMQAGHLPGPGALADKLCSLTSLDNCFFGSSGAEVVEAALKLARKATGRKRIVYAEGGFHGKTLGALSVTPRSKYQEPYEPLIPQCTCVPFNNVAAIENELRQQDVAAIILEPIQGEGGINVPDQGYLQEVRKLCDKYSTLLILDEIQSGMGRTGKMFAYEWEGIKPDILTLAKGLSGMMIPIGAMVAKGSIWNKALGSRKDATQFTSTFGGNNLATIVALTTLKIIEEEKLAQNALEQGDYLLKGLKSLQQRHPKLIKDVRGRGLMVGVEFVSPSDIVSKTLRKATEVVFNESVTTTIGTNLMNKEKIVTAYTLNNSNVLRFEPALTIKKEHIDTLLKSLEKLLSLKYWGLALNGGKIMADSLVKK